MIQRELFDTGPYVDQHLQKCTRDRLSLFRLVRKRTNFFAIFNLYEWSEKVDLDIKNLAKHNIELHEKVVELMRDNQQYMKDNAELRALLKTMHQ